MKNENIFLEMVKNDVRMQGLVSLLKECSIKNFYATKEESSSLFRSLNEITAKMDDVFLRFISLLYFALKFDLKDGCHKENVLDLYRIGSHHCTAAIIRIFNLQKFAFEWDSEYALCRPVTRENGSLRRVEEKELSTMFWDFNRNGLNAWNELMEMYILEKHKEEEKIQDEKKERERVESIIKQLVDQQRFADCKVICEAYGINFADKLQLG